MSVTTPAVPATGVPVTNKTGQFVSVAISANGATISSVLVNGVQVGTAAGNYQLPPAATIAIDYTVATPTWVWTNPIDLSPTPGQTEWNENTDSTVSELPYATHATLAQPGLAAGVSN